MGKQILNVLRPVAAAGLIGVTGGASASLIDSGRAGSTNDKPRDVSDAPKKTEGVLQSAKSRQSRLAGARGRKSFRMALGTTEDTGGPRATRSGISIG